MRSRRNQVLVLFCLFLSIPFFQNCSRNYVSRLASGTGELGSSNGSGSATEPTTDPNPDGSVPNDPTPVALPEAPLNTHAPTWAAGMHVGEWREVSGTSMSLCPPSVMFTNSNGPATRLTAWNSIALDPHDASLYSVANGGHADWQGNEALSIRMSDDNPKWIEIRPSSPESVIVQNQSHYLDGTPTSRHSYYGVDFLPSRHRVILLTGFMYGYQGIMNGFDGFDVNTRAYDKAHTFADLPLSTYSGLGTAFTVDPKTENVYAFAQYQATRWISAENKWEVLLENAPYGYNMATAFDTKRGQILLAGGAPSSYLFNPTTKSLKTVTFTGLGGSAIDNTSGGSALVYVEALDSYFFRKADATGGEVFRIEAGTLSVSKLAVTNGDNVPSAVNKLWKRFLYSEKLGGIFYAPAYSSNIWFLRLH